MKKINRLIRTIFAMMIAVNGYSQISESQLIGYWKHVDALNKADMNVTIDIKPFDLRLDKDHHFEMMGDRVKVKGTWALQDSILILNDPTKGERELTKQKLRILKVDAETLVLTVKDFDVTGGLKIILKKVE